MANAAPLPHHQSCVWVIVADSAQARAYVRVPASEIVARDARQREETLTWDLQPLDDFHFKVGHSPATIYESSGTIRHVSEPHAGDHHKKSREDLARHVADRLNQAKARGAFDYLLIVAPPAWLGLLRPHLDKPAHDAVLAELTKDLTGLPLHELTQRLREVLPAQSWPKSPANR